MNSTRKKRLTRVCEQIDSMPIPPPVVQTAFEHFRETGELPESHRLGAMVIERTLHVTDPDEERVDLETGLERLSLLLDQIEAGELPSAEPRTLRTRLLHAAAYGSESARQSARLALKLLVEGGLDLTDPRLLDDAEVSEAGKLLIDQACTSYWAEQHATSERPVGPPIPEGQALFDWLRRLLECAREFGLRTPEAG